MYRGVAHNFIDLTGLTIENWKVISRATFGKNTKWNCECLLCGDLHRIASSHLNQRRSKNCRKCALNKSKHPSWKGHGGISGTFWCHLLQSAKKRGLIVSITLADIWDLYQLQDGKCALSGLPIAFSRSEVDAANGKNTASLDRIDSTKGYISGNVQWVHKTVNQIKSNLPQN